MDNKNLSSSSSSHRDAFIAHILMQQKQITNSTNNDPTIANSTTSPSLLLLDLGCGYGRDTYHFTTTLGHRVLGIDYSIEMLHHARRLAPLAHYLNMDMRHLKNALVHESLDGIWANSSLLHLPKVDMFDVLQGLYGAMKVGGVLFMSLKVRDAESTVDDEEVFDVDERYVARNSLPPPASVDADAVTAGENVEVSNDDDDTRRKFYSYYTLEEVRELVAKSGWTILEINEEDHRGVSDYVEHTKVYVFATRSNE
jgi:SAM-dependent methyltransferase